MEPDAFDLGRRQRAGLVPDRVRDAQPTQVVQQRRPPHMGDLARRPRQRRRGGGGGEVGDGAGVPDGVRRLQIREITDGLQRGVELRPGQRRARGRLGADDRLPRRGLIKISEQWRRL